MRVRPVKRELHRAAEAFEAAQRKWQPFEEFRRANNLTRADTLKAITANRFERRGNKIRWAR
jgi:DNA replication initiation complex subunit (GINS family)